MPKPPPPTRPPPPPPPPPRPSPPTPSPHRTAYTPTPHGPYCLHSLLYIESLIQASNACPNPLPHRPHRLHPHPARPLLPPLTAVHRKFLQASNACPFPARPLLPPLTAVDRPNPLRPHHPHRPHRLHPHPARPLLPPLTAVDRKFLQASNACPNPSAHTTPGLYAKRSDPNSARVRCLFLLDSMPACVCLLWAKLGIVQKRSLPALHTGYILLQRHIARVDQHSSIARLGVGGTGGSH